MPAENEVYISKVLPSDVPGIGYTLKHRKAVELLIRYYAEKAIGKQDGNGVTFTRRDAQILINRGKCHDMDKVVTSLAYPQHMADYFHRMFNGHHDEGFISDNKKNKFDWMEMIFDWESNSYTKKDKATSCAYLWVTQYREWLYPYTKPYLMLFGLDNAEHGKIESIRTEALKPVTEKDLVDAIVRYFHTTHVPYLQYLSRLDDKGYAQAYGKGVPCRRYAGESNPMVYSRPSESSQRSRSVAAREMIAGDIEAEIFDFDALCSMTETDVANMEHQAKVVHDELNKNRLIR